MVGKSFPSLAGTIFPQGKACKLALVATLVAFVATGCGGASKHSSPKVRSIAGDGFRFDAPSTWSVTRTARSVAARGGGEVVSATVFRLAHAATPQLGAKAVAELDRVAGELAKRQGATVEHPRTDRVAGRNARVYDIVRSGSAERIAFVLVGRREYELYCRGTGAPCDALLASFRIAG